MDNINKKALVIDGNSLFYRCFYATIDLVQWANENHYIANNAIKLMINMVLKLLKQQKYTYMFIAFDDKVKSFRHEVYHEYKQNRTKAPEELYLQLNDTIDCLINLGINTFSKPCFEADDLIGSYVKLMNNSSISVDIITSDKDMLQLVNDLTTVLLVKKGINDLKEINHINFSELYDGLEPKQIIDLKAIVGDSSDNIKGVNGIGNKTCINLLNKYKSVENIFDHVDELTPSVKNKLLNEKENVFFYKKIVTIMQNGLDEYHIDDFLIKEPNKNNLSLIAKKYHLTKLKEDFKI